MIFLKKARIESRLKKLKKLVEVATHKGQCPYKIYKRVKALTIDSSENYIRVLMDAFKVFQRSNGYYSIHLNERNVSALWIARTLKERNLVDEFEEQR